MRHENLLERALKTEEVISMTRTTLKEAASRYNALINAASKQLVQETPDKNVNDLILAVYDNVYGEASERIAIGILNMVGVKTARIADILERRRLDASGELIVVEVGVFRERSTEVEVFDGAIVAEVLEKAGFKVEHDKSAKEVGWRLNGRLCSWADEVKGEHCTLYRLPVVQCGPHEPEPRIPQPKPHWTQTKSGRRRALKLLKKAVAARKKNAAIARAKKLKTRK